MLVEMDSKITKRVTGACEKPDVVTMAACFELWPERGLLGFYLLG